MTRTSQRRSHSCPQPIAKCSGLILAYVKFWYTCTVESTGRRDLEDTGRKDEPVFVLTTRASVCSFLYKGTCVVCGQENPKRQDKFFGPYIVSTLRYYVRTISPCRYIVWRHSMDSMLLRAFLRPNAHTWHPKRGNMSH